MYPLHVICFKLSPQEPYLSEPKGEHRTDGAGFCDSVWRVEPTIVQETEANLVATVYNAGKVRYMWGGIKFAYWGYKCAHRQYYCIAGNFHEVQIVIFATHDQNAKIRTAKF